MKNAGAARNLSLWLMAAPVAVWGLHFLTIYVVAAIYCAKSAIVETAASTPLPPVRWSIAAITVIGVLATGITALAARRAYTGKSNTHSPQDEPCRDRFLASIVLLLCALSAGAMLGVAAVALFFGDCRQ